MFVQQEVAKLAMTAIEYPPMQKGASFNLDAVKAKIAEAMKAQRTVVGVLSPKPSTGPHPFHLVRPERDAATR